MAYLDLIILGLIAGFILLRLRSVLGEKIGQDRPPGMPEYRQETDSPIVRVREPLRALPGKDEDAPLLEKAESSVKQGISAIRAADADFSLSEFLSGARAAFEMVFDAFAKADKTTLEMLLSPELYKMFVSEIDERKQQDRHEETTLVSVPEQEIISAELNRNTARIRLRFVSEQIRVERDREGKIVGGDPATTENVEDEWLFERDVTSRNPNWKIIET